MGEKVFSRDGHVVVFAFPFGTHVAPLFSVINRIANLSPNTQFSFFSTQKANDSLITTAYDLHQSNIKFYNLLINEGNLSSGTQWEEVEVFMKEAPQSFRDGIKRIVAETGREITCVVADAFFWFAAEMAEEMRVPWFPGWTAAPISLSSHFYTDCIRDNFGAMGNEETLNEIPGMSKVHVKDLPEGILFGDTESFFSQVLHKMGKMLPKADAVFINSFEELDPIITKDLNSKFNRLLCTGPFNLISPPKSTSQPFDPYGCIAWLNKQKPKSVAYVSFGSVVTPPPQELVALAEALEASNVPFVWSLKDHAREHLPNGFIERTKSQGIVVAWAPQMAVLTHCTIGVFLTHCGWNSVLESIMGGIPMVCRPFFGDQRLNARMIQDVWEIGIQVEGGVLTKNEVLFCLDKVFEQEKGKKSRENVRVLKEAGERAIQPEGSSFKNIIILAELMTNLR